MARATAHSKKAQLMNVRLNWILFVGVVVLIAGNALLIFGMPRWMTGKQPASQDQSKNEPSCTKVSDFYSVHLTTYFLAATADADLRPNGREKMYMQYCDRVPGTGRLIFTIDLMEQDARNMPVEFSLSKYDAEGRLSLVKKSPAAVHPGGVLTLDAVIMERGKYLLKLAFGNAKTNDEIIEMPVLVGSEGPG